MGFAPLYQQGNNSMSQGPISITGLNLQAVHDRVWVEIEIDGRWVTVVSEHYAPGNVIGHIVEPSGMRRALTAALTKDTA